MGKKKQKVDWRVKNLMEEKFLEFYDNIVDGSYKEAIAFYENPYENEEKD